MKNILLFIVLFHYAWAGAQQTDFLRIKKYKVATLPYGLKETSALAFINNELFSLNDSGNTADLFKIDPGTGKILQQFGTGLQNTDWEALTTDGMHLYIGDFGNNNGYRNDLSVYKVHRDSLRNGNSETVAMKIPFFYPEQMDFSPRNRRHDFDAEAMIFLNRNIHIFTKEWLSARTTHYIVNPEIADVQPARKLESTALGFMVTDAAYFNGKLYLLGYTKKAEIFLSIFEETNPGVFFEQKPHQYYLGTVFGVGQTEGIAVNEDGIYISAEAFRKPMGASGQSLYFIPHLQIKTGK